MQNLHTKYEHFDTSKNCQFLSLNFFLFFQSQCASSGSTAAFSGILPAMFYNLLQYHVIEKKVSLSIKGCGIISICVIEKVQKNPPLSQNALDNQIH